MKLFADTADLRELKELDEMGLICGITTNPTIASQTGKNLVDVLANIAKEFPEIPVFGQVVAKDTEGKKYCGKAACYSGGGKSDQDSPCGGD